MKSITLKPQNKKKTQKGSEPKQEQPTPPKKQPK